MLLTWSNLLMALALGLVGLIPVLVALRRGHRDRVLGAGLASTAALSMLVWWVIAIGQSEPGPMFLTEPPTGQPPELPPIFTSPQQALLFQFTRHIAPLAWLIILVGTVVCAFKSKSNLPET